jgi:hypothetical protein
MGYAGADHGRVSGARGHAQACGAAHRLGRALAAVTTGPVGTSQQPARTHTQLTDRKTVAIHNAFPDRGFQP